MITIMTDISTAKKIAIIIRMEIIKRIETYINKTLLLALVMCDVILSKKK